MIFMQEVRKFYSLFLYKSRLSAIEISEFEESSVQEKVFSVWQIEQNAINLHLFICTGR